MTLSLAITVFSHGDVDKDAISLPKERKREGPTVLCKDFIIAFIYSNFNTRETRLCNDVYHTSVFLRKLALLVEETTAC